MLEGISIPGWKLLVKPKEVSNEIKTASGAILYRPDESVDVEQHRAVVCEVVLVGEQAYDDPARFTHPWVKVGDWVLLGKYAGRKFNLDGKKYFLINDDEVLALIDNPDRVSAAT